MDRNFLVGGSEDDALRSASWRAKSTPPTERLAWNVSRIQRTSISIDERARTYGVMGMELRIRDPRAEGVAPSCLGVAPTDSLLSPEPGWRAGVSRTNLRNCELFILSLRGGCVVQEFGADPVRFVRGRCTFFQPRQDF